MKCKILLIKTLEKKHFSMKSSGRDSNPQKIITYVIFRENELSDSIRKYAKSFKKL